VDYGNPQGAMEFTLAPGTHEVRARFADTPVRTWATRLSWLALLLLLATTRLADLPGLGGRWHLPGLGGRWHPPQLVWLPSVTRWARARAAWASAPLAALRPWPARIQAAAAPYFNRSSEIGRASCRER